MAQPPIKIGMHLAQMHGDYTVLRKRWSEAEAMGVDALYVSDHFFAQKADTNLDEGAQPVTQEGKIFEGTTLQAAMAATTTRPEIGCIVHANSYRNPNLLADMARTIDHISGGRFILGLGSGYLKQDYDDYGYEYGTQKSRLLDLARDIPIMKARFEKLNPPPVRKIPLLIASMGEKIGMRIVAEHADIWHLYGSMDFVAEKIEKMKAICAEIGRDFSEIELMTWYMTGQNTASSTFDPDEYLKLGIRNIVQLQLGPDWDLGPLRELLAWRKAQSQT